MSRSLQKISNTPILKFENFPFEEEVVIIDNDASASLFLSEVINFEPSNIIYFDCEWNQFSDSSVPMHSKLSIVSLFKPGMNYYVIVNIVKLRYVPVELIKIFSSSNLIKVGYAITNDMNIMSSAMCPICLPFVDLALTFKMKRHQTVSLLDAFVMSVPLIYENKSARLVNVEKARRLKSHVSWGTQWTDPSHEQYGYAANDIFMTYTIDLAVIQSLSWMKGKELDINVSARYHEDSENEDSGHFKTKVITEVDSIKDQINQLFLERDRSGWKGMPPSLSALVQIAINSTKSGREIGSKVIYDIINKYKDTFRYDHMGNVIGFNGF